ncbi:MAG: TonB-dependent receptor, partial [Gemmatimonadetes bacterium]|nr:TonB-dependent receptor [Gemmatimonadota bacterium]
AEVAVSIYGVRRELDNPIPTSVIDLGRSGGGVRIEAGSEWHRRGQGARIDFGIETEAQIDERRNFRNRGGEAGTLTLDQEERVGALAAFATLRLSLARRLEGTFALRADRLRFQVDDRLVEAEDPDDSGVRSMGAVSPSLGLYLGLGEHGLFAALSGSFETPTTTELANRPSGAGGFNPELGAARGRSVEAGARGALGPDLRYDATLFATYLSGQLVPFEVLSAPGRRFYRNAGRSRTHGVEVFVDADLHSPLSVRLAYEYLDARYTDFTVDEARLDGNRVPGVAPHLAEATLRADGAEAGWGWFAELRVERRGEVPLSDANDATAPGHTLLEVRIGADAVEWGPLRLVPLFAVTNLTNRRYASSVVVNAFGGRYFEPGPTRGGYLGLSVGWERP